MVLEILLSTLKGSNIFEQKPNVHFLCPYIQFCLQLRIWLVISVFAPWWSIQPLS
uniref:Uncharacterized protein n=1 Tax=Anguilla anguilla TaxID=7936 RepID=A0A0E9PGW9_ANGAN